MKKALALLVAMATLSGCNNDHIDNEIIAGEERQISGLWFGEIDTISGDVAETVAIITIDGQFASISLSPEEAILTDVTFSGNTVSSTTGLLYQYSTSEFSGVLSATLSGDNALMGRFEGPGLNFSLSPLPASETPFAGFRGNYAADDVSLAIDEDGQLTGSDWNGCTISGDVTPWEATPYLASLTITLSGCSVTGDLEGTYEGVVAYGIFPFDGNEFPGLIILAEMGPYLFRYHLIEG